MPHSQNRPSKGDSPKHTPSTYEGVIAVTSRGIGYVANEAFEEDIEIQNENLNTALSGDTVLISLLPPKHNVRQQGAVETILTRSKLGFAGVLEEESGNFFLVPDDRKMYVHIGILKEDAAGAEAGDKVYGKITSWNDPKKSPRGKVVAILGKKGENNAEMAAIVLERGFSPEFPKEVEAEAKHTREEAGKLMQAEIKARRDFRDILTFTIDPIDAKDFDDAISIRSLGNNLLEIGVHIADVSHFVRPGTELDKEASKRATSIYLVDRTIPMLPEILSNDLASLNPEEEKLTFSVVFTMNDKGDVVDRWFGKTVIRSDKRFTYEEAQEIIEGKEGPYQEELRTLQRIGKVLEREKFHKGAISFEQDEVKFVLDETGRPIKVLRKVRKDAHKLVEEFMLLANREVAEHIERLSKEAAGKYHPFVYRIHDLPDQEKIKELAVFIKALGYELNIKKNGQVTNKDINALLQQVEGKAEEGLIKTAAVRTMAKAIYTTKNIGHFGLAFQYYTHFTSPIRRYPDLLVHRLLEKHLTGQPVSQEEIARLEKLSQHSTEREIAAADAERSSIKMKQVEYMQERLGQEFEGIISGVSEWGIYIEEKETRCEGMVRLRDMKDDFYALDQKNYCLVGQKTKKKYTLGDTIRFKAMGADIEKKTLDYTLV